jgi:hypothetical protein
MRRRSLYHQSFQKVAYPVTGNGNGLPIIIVNRFRGTLDTWDPSSFDGLAAAFNVITGWYKRILLTISKFAGLNLQI